jgi:hypothetical protein
MKILFKKILFMLTLGICAHEVQASQALNHKNVTEKQVTISRNLITAGVISSAIAIGYYVWKRFNKITPTAPTNQPPFAKTPQQSAPIEVIEEEQTAQKIRQPLLPKNIQDTAPEYLKTSDEYDLKTEQFFNLEKIPALFQGKGIQRDYSQDCVFYAMFFAHRLSSMLKNGDSFNFENANENPFCSRVEFELFLRKKNLVKEFNGCINTSITDVRIQEIIAKIDKNILLIIPKRIESLVGKSYSQATYNFENKLNFKNDTQVLMVQKPKGHWVVFGIDHNEKFYFVDSLEYKNHTGFKYTDIDYNLIINIFKARSKLKIEQYFSIINKALKSAPGNTILIQKQNIIKNALEQLKANEESYMFTEKLSIKQIRELVNNSREAVEELAT